MRAKEAFSPFAGGPMTPASMSPDRLYAGTQATLDGIVAGFTPASIFCPSPARRRRPGIVASGCRPAATLAMAMSHPRIKGASGSGIYDLEPIRHSYLNVKLGLDEAMSHRNSPIRQTESDQADGADGRAAELPLLRSRPRILPPPRARFGLPVSYVRFRRQPFLSGRMLAPTGRITLMIRQLLSGYRARRRSGR
jgi:arylformamidase